MAYMLILILVLLYAVWRGWRTGLVHQLAGVLGMAFGIVCARIFCDPASQWLVEHSPGLGEGFAAEYKLHVISSALIFAVVFLLFKVIAGILKSAMSVLRVGVLNSMAGAAFSLLKWVMIMSVIYNVILALSPHGTLADYCDDGDANLVEAVMSAAPALMGVCGPDDLEHLRHVEEAKSISENCNGAFGSPLICLV